ncbi:MAG: hypothetical protein ABIF87_03300 [Pseudomonadota bacterium]
MTDLAPNVSTSKFHPLFGSDIRVALEATFASDATFDFVNGAYFSELIHQSPKHFRIYYPAIVGGDMARDQEGRITFVPWIDESEAQYHRLCFWAQPVTTKKFFALFGRFGETNGFGFNDPRKPYLHLDFFGKRQDQFIPLYVRVRNRQSDEIVNLAIEGRAGEDQAELILRRVELNELPPCLQYLRIK